MRRGAGPISILEDGVIRFFERVVGIVPFIFNFVPPSFEPELPYAENDDTDDCYTSNDTTNDSTDVWTTAAGADVCPRGAGIGRLDARGSGTSIAIAEGLVADLVRLARRTAGRDVWTQYASFEDGVGRREFEGCRHC
jgi:hypothetical protein